ncbi:MAG: hypothetical protein OEZ22_06455 [Spirochaetia bacterium]|nr:hypothetical protein [Spirochaetia bacterium]
MDYLALGLLFIGALLVLSGILLTHSEKIREGTEYVAVELAKQNKIKEKINLEENIIQKQPSQTLPKENNYAPRVPQQAPFPHILTEAPDKISGFPGYKIPKIFSKEAVLYFDNANNSIYNGKEETLNIEDFSGLRRVGKGSFSYNGFNFIFENNGLKQEFDPASLSHLAFYPNCLVLVSKSDLPPALFFMDETENTRKALESFNLSKV